MIYKRMALVAACVLVLPACSPDGAEAPETGEPMVIDGEEIADADLFEEAVEEGNVTVYSGYPEELELQVQEEFTEDTGISVENVRLPSPRLYERVMTEFGADELQADIIRLSDPGFTQDMLEEGILSTHEVPAWDSIPDDYKHEEGYFYASLIQIMGFGYNTELVEEDEAPGSWAELLDEEWHSDIGMLYAASGATWTVAMFQREELGDDYWEDLAEQNPTIVPSTATLTEEVIRGEAPVSINHIGGVGVQMEDGAPIDYLYPEEGVAGAAQYLSKSSVSENDAAAELFVNWSMSQRGSEAASRTFDYHPHEDMPPITIEGEEQPALDELELFYADEETWIDRQSKWSEEWEPTFGYEE